MHGKKVNVSRKNLGSHLTKGGGQAIGRSRYTNISSGEPKLKKYDLAYIIRPSGLGRVLVMILNIDSSYAEVMYMLPPSSLVVRDTFKIELGILEPAQ